MSASNWSVVACITGSDSASAATLRITGYDAHRAAIRSPLAGGSPEFIASCDAFEHTSRA